MIAMKNKLNKLTYFFLIVKEKVSFVSSKVYFISHLPLTQPRQYVYIIKLIHKKRFWIYEIYGY